MCGDETTSNRLRAVFFRPNPRNRYGEGGIAARWTTDNHADVLPNNSGQPAAFHKGHTMPKVSQVMGLFIPVAIIVAVVFRVAPVRKVIVGQ